MDEPEGTWLADHVELRALPQRYARAADGRDIDAMAELFDPAGTVDGVRGEAAVPDYLETMRTAPRAFATSMHFFADPLIELEPGSDRGRMDAYAVVHQLRGPGEEGSDLQLGMRYLDDVVRLDGRWVVHHRETQVLWMPRGRPLRPGRGRPDGVFPLW